MVRNSSWFPIAVPFSIRLIVCALVILLLYEGVTRGFAFGHAIFYEEAVDSPPGTDQVFTVEEGDTEQVYTRPKEEYTRRLIASIPRIERKGLIPMG